MEPALGISKLLQAEADQDIFEPAIDGFALWPVVRYRAWQIVSRVEPRVMRGGLWGDLIRRPREVTRFLYALWAFWQRRRIRRRRNPLVFLSLEAHRCVRRSDGWWEVYLDDIANHPILAPHVLRCEFRAFALSPWRTAAPRHLFTDAQLLDQVLAGLRSEDPEATQQGGRLAQTWCQKLADQGYPLDESARRGFERYCVTRARMFRRALAWWGRLFDDVRPTAFVLTDAYDQHAPVAAALQRGIPAIEFQHGVIHRDHPGYVWAGLTRAVRERLPIPTHVATYGRFWSDLLLAGGFWQPEEIFSIGSARMDWLRRRAARRRNADDTLAIIFTTQHPSRATAITLWREFSDLAEQRGLHYRLIIKVHRMETPFLDEYRDLARSRPHVSVLSAYEGDTLELIAESDVHVSAWSTCHYEAATLGTPTVVLRFPGPDRTADLAGLPGVWTAGSADELLDVLEQARHAAPRREEIAAAADHLFRRGAVQNAAELLSRWLPGHGTNVPARP